MRSASAGALPAGARGTSGRRGESLRGRGTSARLRRFEVAIVSPSPLERAVQPLVSPSTTPNGGSRRRQSSAGSDAPGALNGERDLARQDSPAPPWTAAQPPRRLKEHEAHAVPSASRAPDPGTAPTPSPQRDHRCPQPQSNVTAFCTFSACATSAPRSPLSYRDAAAGGPKRRGLPALLLARLPRRWPWWGVIRPACKGRGDAEVHGACGAAVAVASGGDAASVGVLVLAYVDQFGDEYGVVCGEVDAAAIVMPSGRARPAAALRGRAMRRGDYAQARMLFEQALTTFRQLRDRGDGGTRALPPWRTRRA